MLVEGTGSSEATGNVAAERTDISEAVSSLQGEGVDRKGRTILPGLKDVRQPTRCAPLAVVLVLPFIIPPPFAEDPRVARLSIDRPNFSGDRVSERDASLSLQTIRRHTESTSDLQGVYGVYHDGRRRGTTYISRRGGVQLSLQRTFNGPASLEGRHWVRYSCIVEETFSLDRRRGQMLEEPLLLEERTNDRIHKSSYLWPVLEETQVKDW